MDYHTVTDHWEEEIHSIDSSMWCNLLWTVIPLSWQVSVQILQFSASKQFFDDWHLELQCYNFLNC